MNKKIKYILFLFCLFLISSRVYADENIELKDGVQINDNTTVTSYNSATIYVETKELKIENFETIVDGRNVYRIYVSLDDLVENIPTISYKINEDNNIINLTRKYDKKIDGFDVYYDTEHDISKRTFKSLLFVGENDSILFGDETRDEILTADADTLKINDKVYVSLRFVTESLGAEVVYKVLDDKEIVTIDFFSSDKYAKFINLEWKDESGNIVSMEDVEKSSNGKCFTPNFYYSYREENQEEFKKINNTYSKLYSGDQFLTWNIDDKKLCSENNDIKTLNNTKVVIKYRGVPVTFDIKDLGISKYCGVDDLKKQENCNNDSCSNNEKCGIIQGEYYCCETTTHNSENKQKVMLITGHAPGGSDCGAENEAKKTREIGQIVEKYLKNYVDVKIFNRDVMGEDINSNSYNISALQYLASCNDKSSYKYADTICETTKDVLGNDYDFSEYSYVLELHFNDEGGSGTFITSADKCSDSSDSSRCMQTSENAEKLKKITTSIMSYMKNTGIPYNSISNNGIRDDWYALERYVRVSTDHKVPASLMEVCALDHDIKIYESNKEEIGKSIARGIVEGLGITWNE